MQNAVYCRIIIAYIPQKIIDRCQNLHGFSVHISVTADLIAVDKQLCQARIQHMHSCRQKIQHSIDHKAHKRIACQHDNSTCQTVEKEGLDQPLEQKDHYNKNHIQPMKLCDQRKQKLNDNRRYEQDYQTCKIMTHKQSRSCKRK